MAPNRRRFKNNYRPVINDVFRYITWNQSNLAGQEPKKFKCEECLGNFANVGALATHVYRHPHQHFTYKRFLLSQNLEKML